MALRSIPPRTRPRLNVSRMGRNSQPVNRHTAEGVGEARSPSLSKGQEYLSTGSRYSIAKHTHPAPKAQPLGRELLISPRSAGSPSHTLLETSDGYHICVIFPGQIFPDDIRWELVSDILEVEYIGQRCSYFHDFFVPAECPPNVFYRPSSVEFVFPRGVGRV